MVAPGGASSPHRGSPGCAERAGGEIGSSFEQRLRRAFKGESPAGSMVDKPTTTMQCNDCGTEFDPADPAAAQNHVGHDVVKIEQG
jgi:hypothetical protein